MADNLFNEFEPVSSKQWKQQIQYELKGADYNETLVWESPEGIKVKPFYHDDESEMKLERTAKDKTFSILQNIFVHDVKKSNERALDTLNRGAESIRFTIENETIALEELMQNLPLGNVQYFFYLPSLSIDFANKINDFAAKNNAIISLQIDPIGQLTKEGNWFENLDKDFNKLNSIASKSTSPFINISSGIYQNAGANMVQQLAYTLAHVNEYFNRIPNLNQPITIEVAVGTNYFFACAFQPFCTVINYLHGNFRFLFLELCEDVTAVSI
jgi:methylmalonyl-CoA mutase